jgi:hypothetical protein
MTAVPDRLALARRIDVFADDAEARGNQSRAAELRELASALRAKRAAQVRAGRLKPRGWSAEAGARATAGATGRLQR